MRHAEGAMAGQPPVTSAQDGTRDRESGQADRSEQRPGGGASDNLPRTDSHPGPWDPGLEDAEVDALEAQIIDEDFTGEHERRQAQNAQRRLQDRVWLDEVTALGFTGPLFEVYWQELAAYGVAVTMAWTRTGRISARCKAMGRPLQFSIEFGRGLSRDDRIEIAVETVARALNFFLDQVLKPGKWDHRRGASLKTYFVGACLLQFPNVFAVWASEQKRWHAVNDGTVSPDDAEAATARDLSRSDPTCEMVLRLAAAQDVLGTIKDAKLRAAVQMVARGFTFAEAARTLGLGPRVLEGRLYRLRSKTSRSGRRL
jgi:hypothetical protein